MKKGLFTLLSVAAVAVLGSTAQAEEQAHWGYTGHGSPEQWGTLSEKYKECGTGLNQSPINITHSLHANLPPLDLKYVSDSVDVVDNGHTIQIDMAAGSTVTIDDKVFELKQFHFHAPSENHIDGKTFPLEGHFVNIDKEGNIAVVGVMFEEGEENTVLDQVWDIMPNKSGETKNLKLSKIAAALLPKDTHYYRFSGSLTTPPCTEGVIWMVLKTPVNISKAQVEKFHAIMHHNNNRPVQPLDGRVIVE